jgi:hypothetical protein
VVKLYLVGRSVQSVRIPVCRSGTGDAVSTSRSSGMSPPRDRRRQPGFTLVVGILVAVAIPLYANVQAWARRAKAHP